MLPRPIEVQANVIVHLKVTIRSIAGHEIGLQPKKSAETNGIIVNFFEMSDITSSRTNVSVEEDNLFDEVIFAEIS